MSDLANIFWDADDTEKSADSIAEILERRYGDGTLEFGDEITVQRAVRLENIRVLVIPDPADPTGFDYAVIDEIPVYAPETPNTLIGEPA